MSHDRNIIVCLTNHTQLPAILSPEFFNKASPSDEAEEPVEEVAVTDAEVLPDAEASAETEEKPAELATTSPAETPSDVQEEPSQPLEETKPTESPKEPELIFMTPSDYADAGVARDVECSTNSMLAGPEELPQPVHPGQPTEVPLDPLKSLAMQLGPLYPGVLPPPQMAVPLASMEMVPPVQQPAAVQSQPQPQAQRNSSEGKVRVNGVNTKLKELYSVVVGVAVEIIITAMVVRHNPTVM